MSSVKSNKLVCIITGRKLIATKNYYARKVEKIGSEHELHRTYICREAKNLLRQGSSVDKVRQVLGVIGEVPEEIDQDIINDVVNEGTKTNMRRINNIVSVSNMINNQTDPAVKEYIKNISIDG